MLEADRRQEEGIFMKYQGYFIWRRITPLKGRAALLAVLKPAEFTQFYTEPAQDFDGDFKALWCLNLCISYPRINIPPSQNTLAEQCSCAQSSALLNLIT